MVPKGRAQNLISGWRPILLMELLLQVSLSCFEGFRKASLLPQSRVWGFDAGVSTSHALAPTVSIFRSAAFWQACPALVAATDITTAFEAVSFATLRAALLEYNFSEREAWRVLFELQGGTFVVTGNDFISEPFCPTTAGRPGARFYPWLFMLVIDTILRPLQSKWERWSYGVKLGHGNHFTTICWADNIFIYASSVAQLTIMLEDIARICF